MSYDYNMVYTHNSTVGSYSCFTLIPSLSIPTLSISTFSKVKLTMGSRKTPSLY